MANSIYDPRIEPHAYVVIIDEETRARLCQMECVVGMRSTLGNRVISICANGIKLQRGNSEEEYFVREAEVFLEEAQKFGFGKTPAEIADGLITGINECRTLNSLDRFERVWRDLWRRLNQHPTAIQPPGFMSTKFTEYDRVMGLFAKRKRQLEMGAQ